MASEDRRTSSDADVACVVCFKNVDIYSIGVCDHPVCFECSMRMRILCEQNECPICRSDMAKVIFTKEKRPFAELYQKHSATRMQDVKYGLLFCTPSIQRSCYRLLDNTCPLCQNVRYFNSFNILREHVRRDHEMFYCDLCVNDLKIFPFERRSYTRTELAHHRRKGDTDNTSHRGHPLCEFCDQRYMDSDELFRHLRRDHLYCHFCDADGKHQYYSTYDDLRQHFLEDHYLCEEGECKNLEFTSVFRSEIDFKAHVALEHSRHLSRAANKQARMLEVEFNFTPRRNDQGQRGGRRPHRPDDPSDSAITSHDHNNDPGGTGGHLFVNPLNNANFPSLGGSSETPQQNSRASVTVASKFIPKLNEDNFPTLGGAPRQNVTTSNQQRLKKDDFPRLGTPGPSSNVTITKTAASVSAAGSSASGLFKTPKNFPVLSKSQMKATSGGNSSTVKFTLNQPNQQASTGPQNLSIHVNHNKNNNTVTTRISTAPAPTPSAEAFPALGPASTPVEPLKQWVQPKPKKTAKAAKVTPAPVLPPSSLSDFPSLTRHEEVKVAKKVTSVTMPVSTAWVNSQEANKGKKTKKESNNNVDKKPIKKKQKNKQDTAENNNKADTNGLVKKTSSLNIGSLEMPLSDEPEAKLPPGISVKPPPGFSCLPKNELTFTSSSGQSYSIMPSHTYYRPQDFMSRNAKLIEKFQSVLLNEDTVKEFKSYSELFRIGSYPPEKYYTHCQSVMRDQFDRIFPELLVLLPDIERQQDLYRVHKGKVKNLKGLEVCATCKQVIATIDLKDHLKSHYMENHFPSLGAMNFNEKNAWKK